MRVFFEEIKSKSINCISMFAYAKGTSKIKTDISRDIIRVIDEDYNITSVSAISIDDTWSALRVKSIEKVGK